MSISSESAEQMTGMILKTEEVCLRVTGVAAKEIIALLAAILKSKSQTKGKTNLTNMLKSGKELKVFSVRKEDLKKFTQEAKRYGVLYSALINRHNKNFDNMVDIMVRAEDASKINRIVERFKISTVDEAQIRNEIVKNRTEKVPKDIDIQIKDKELIAKEKQELAPIQKVENENKLPLVAKDNNENQSKNLSGTLKNREGNIKVKKKSVRQQIKEIKEEISKEEKSSSKNKEINAKGKTKINNKSNVKKEKLVR